MPPRLSFLPQIGSAPATRTVLATPYLRERGHTLHLAGRVEEKKGLTTKDVWRGSNELSVITRPGVVREIGSSYPGVKSLLEYNPKGTLALLIAAEAVQFDRYYRDIVLHYSGHDDLKVWRDYKLKIEEYLEGINNDEHLRRAREAVADVIYTEHYTAYPCWPAKGTSQESCVKLDASGSYPSVNKDVFWSVSGYLTVKDRRSLTDSRVTTGGVFATIFTFGIADAKKKTYNFETECSGRPDMRAVVIDRTEMRRVERLVGEDWEKAIQTADMCLPELTWDSLLEKIHK